MKSARSDSSSDSNKPSLSVPDKSHSRNDKYQGNLVGQSWEHLAPRSGGSEAAFTHYRVPGAYIFTWLHSKRVKNQTEKATCALKTFMARLGFALQNKETVKWL